MATDLVLAAGSAPGALLYAVTAVTGYRATGDRPVTPWDRLAAILGMWGAWGVLAAERAARVAELEKELGL